MNIAYHEISFDDLKDALINGLKCTSRGDKGDDEHIIETDHMLDSQRPAILREQGVSRDSNLYAYLASGDTVIDITDGQTIPLTTFVKRSKQAVLALTINPSRCFVSDLDAYDEVKSAFANRSSASALRHLAERYWKTVVPLNEYAPFQIARPELMITYDISPTNLQHLKQ